jgi:hypothetical protein
MAKAPKAPSPEDVRAALVAWGEKRSSDPQLAYIREDPQKRLEELSRILEANQAAICGEIVAALRADYFLTRLRLNDVLPEFREYFARTYRSRPVLDFLRAWFRKISEGRIRVEGDPDGGGYYLDFSAEAEQGEGEAEFEPFPMNHADSPAGKGITH